MIWIDKKVRPRTDGRSDVVTFSEWRRSASLVIVSLSASPKLPHHKLILTFRGKLGSGFLLVLGWRQDALGPWGRSRRPQGG